MYFEYGAKEITYLSKKDARLKEAIERIGMIYREVDDDLFVSVIHHIVGQQISSKAQATVWQRLNVLLGEINYQNILAIDDEKYREIGINGRKLSYIKEFADKVKNQSFDIWSLKDKSDEETAKEGLDELEKWMHDLGLVMHAKDLGMTLEMLEEVADKVLITSGGYKTLNHEEIVEILKASL